MAKWKIYYYPHPDDCWYGRNGLMTLIIEAYRSGKETYRTLSDATGITVERLARLFRNGQGSLTDKEIACLAKILRIDCHLDGGDRDRTELFRERMEPRIVDLVVGTLDEAISRSQDYKHLGRGAIGVCASDYSPPDITGYAESQIVYRYSAGTGEMAHRVRKRMERNEKIKRLWASKRRLEEIGEEVQSVRTWS
jgi:hypothetical protein